MATHLSTRIQDSAGNPLDFPQWEPFRDVMGVIDVKRGHDAVGDGIADDTTEIQAAFDAAGGSGGTVVFPPGTYLVSEAGTLTHQGVNLHYCLKIPSSVTIVLDPAATIKAADASNSCIFVNDGIAGAGNTDISIRGGKIDGNRANQTGAATGNVSGMQFHNVRRLTVRDIIINDVYTYALYALGIYDAYLDNLSCDGSEGNAFHLGGNGTEEGASARMIDSYIGSLRADNIDGTVAGTLGNPLTFAGDRCYLGSLEAKTCGEGVKVQNGCTDSHFDSIFVEDSQSMGIKIQGSSGLEVLRGSFGTLRATNCKDKGVYITFADRVSIGQIKAFNCGIGGSAPNVRIGDDVEYVQIGSIFSDTAQGDGVGLTDINTQFINIGRVVVNAPSLQSGNFAGVSIKSDDVNIGSIQTTVGGVSPRHSVRINPQASNVRIETIDAHGSYNTSVVEYESTDNIQTPSVRVDGVEIRTVAGGATLTLTKGLHDGKTVLWDQAAGTILTLPAATGTGMKLRLVVSVTATTNNHSVACVGTDEFNGSLTSIDVDTADATLAFAAEEADNFDTITFNRSTTGLAAKGDWVELEDVATGVWAITGVFRANGAVASPFTSVV